MRTDGLCTAPVVVTPQNQQVLQELLQSYGIHARDDQAQLLLRHLELLLVKNRVMNLTRIESVGDGLVLHLLDSLLFLGLLNTTKGPVLDLGTGGGFPGIPLAVMTDRQFVLMDSVKKKTVAVSEFINELGLASRATVTSERAEAYGSSHRSQFGAVVARAVAPLGTLLEYAQPLLRMHGALIVSKGRIEEQEVSAAERVASLIGMRLVSRETFELPEQMGHRELFMFQKEAKSSVKLPRAIGEAKKHPLA